MANDAVHVQLPIMVRRPKAVWPGLDRMDMHRKEIAGDGNCLFASLADQLCGTPEKHLEIRAAIIEHMRNFRPLFESFTIKDDIQQKRATRAATNAIKNTASDDPFEDYLAIMCKPGTYGGEPELMAFVQCYDQDVSVHLPYITGYPETWTYANQYRLPGSEIKPQLHLCYGGDEISHAHYDSARKNSPILRETPLTERPKKNEPSTSLVSDLAGHTKPMTSRAIRGSKLDLSRDLMHDMIVKGSKDLRSGFDDADRARSPSVSSSHHSSSSKRSFDDDGEPQRATKRADRRKSTRSRGLLESTSVSNTTKLRIKSNAHSRRSTPPSTQNSDDSSDQSDKGTDLGFQLSQDVDVTPDLSQESASQSRSAHGASSVVGGVIATDTLARAIVNERSQSTLQA